MLLFPPIHRPLNIPRAAVDRPGVIHTTDESGSWRAPEKRTGKFIVVFRRVQARLLLVNACPLEKKKNGHCCGAQCRKPNCHLAWHYTAGRNEPGGSNVRAIAGGESRTGG